jgi:hypothetical protein
MKRSCMLYNIKLGHSASQWLINYWGKESEISMVPTIKVQKPRLDPWNGGGKKKRKKMITLWIGHHPRSVGIFVGTIFMLCEIRYFRSCFLSLGYPILGRAKKWGWFGWFGLFRPTPSIHQSGLTKCRLGMWFVICPQFSRKKELLQ